MTPSVSNGLPGGIFGRSVFLALDAAERAVYESLSPTQHSVWNAWVSGGLYLVAGRERARDGRHCRFVESMRPLAARLRCPSSEGRSGSGRH